MKRAGKGTRKRGRFKVGARQECARNKEKEETERQRERERQRKQIEKDIYT